MNYYSLNRKTPATGFKNAAIQGQAPDGGLYFPEYIPVWDEKFRKEAKTMAKTDMACRVMAPYTGGDIPEESLRSILTETLDFDIPLVRVTDKAYALELFHGPTLAFKDVGARFMSRCLGYFARDIGSRIVVLVATSGDTGGAVAHGFLGVPGVDVVILYPTRKVSPVQEKQLTTLGGNIHALEVAGNFDDCQRMVKTAFSDTGLRRGIFLTSANSINVARWLPQQLYYVLAWQQWPEEFGAPVISVPSGNFGNICAGLVAHRSGLPVRHFVAACNINDTVPRYLEAGSYAPVAARPTLSNAMDVADPSNFIRILELTGHKLASLQELLSSFSITDAETEAALEFLYRKQGYIADPHGAVGYLALDRYLAGHPGQKGIFLETAHPVKFPDSVERIIGKPVEVPAHTADLLKGEKKATPISTNYMELKELLTRTFSS